MLLLDTSFVVELESEVASRSRGPAHRTLAARPMESVAISIISVGEFAEGFTDVRDVDTFISRFRILQLSRAIAYRAAALQAALPRRLGENDAWIAATALAYDATLIGRDRSFERVPRLAYLPF